MISAVFDTNIFVSAFLTRYRSTGVTTELLRFVRAGSVRLFLSPAIVDEVANTLLRSERMRHRYDYTPGLVALYCTDLLRAPNIEVIENPPATPGAVPADPDDDKIVPVPLQPTMRTWSRETRIFSCLGPTERQQ